MSIRYAEYLDDMSTEVSILLGFPEAWLWQDTRKEKMVSQNPLRLWDIYLSGEIDNWLLSPSNNGPSVYEY